MPSNTGQQEKEQRDVNPTSPTFGQLRWVAGGENLAACPLPSINYRSTAISGTVYRDDCGTGTSSGATYTVPAGHTVSAISQEDANAQAAAYFNATSADFALANTTCSSAPPAGSGQRFCQFEGNALQGTFTGYMVDAAGNLYIPTAQECSECNGQQDPSAPYVNC